MGGGRGCARLNGRRGDENEAYLLFHQVVLSLGLSDEPYAITAAWTRHRIGGMIRLLVAVANGGHEMELGSRGGIRT